MSIWYSCCCSDCSFAENMMYSFQDSANSYYQYTKKQNVIAPLGAGLGVYKLTWAWKGVSYPTNFKGNFRVAALHQTKQGQYLDRKDKDRKAPHLYLCQESLNQKWELERELFPIQTMQISRVLGEVS